MYKQIDKAVVHLLLKKKKLYKIWCQLKGLLNSNKCHTFTTCN